MVRDKGPYIMTSKQKGGGGVLKFVTCLWILLFPNNRSIVHFSEWWGRGGQKIGNFCGLYKWMTPKAISCGPRIVCPNKMFATSEKVSPEHIRNEI